MARIWTSGIELQSITNGVEFTDTANTPTINTTIKHSGLASMRSNIGAASGSTARYLFATSDQFKQMYFRTYFFFTTQSGTTMALIQIQNSAASTIMRVEVDGATKKWQFINSEDGITTTGTTVAATDQWYCVELAVNTTTIAATTWELRVNQVTECSGTENFATGLSRIRVGSGNNPSNCDIYWDDMAINDSTGAFENSWCGLVKGIVYLRPSAQGDANAWAVNVGGTAGQANNFSRENETPPNDITSYNGSPTLNEVDSYNIDDTPADLLATDNVNVVQLGVRFAGEAASANASFVVRVKKPSTTTVVDGSVITPNATAFATNAISDPRLLTLTMYADPDGNKWSKGVLDTDTQIGTRISTTNTNDVRVTATYLIVEYKDGGAHLLPLLGVGT